MRRIVMLAVAATLASGMAPAQSLLGTDDRPPGEGLLSSGGPPSLRAAVDGPRIGRTPTPLEGPPGSAGSALPRCYPGSFECDKRANDLPPLSDPTYPARPSLAH